MLKMLAEIQLKCTINPFGTSFFDKGTLCDFSRHERRPHAVVAEHSAGARLYCHLTQSLRPRARNRRARTRLSSTRRRERRSQPTARATVVAAGSLHYSCSSAR